MVSFKEQLKNKTLTSYLEKDNKIEELLNKRLLNINEKKVLRIYLENPQGINDYQASALLQITIDEIRNLRKSIDQKVGTHLIVNNKTNIYFFNKKNNL